MAILFLMRYAMMLIPASHPFAFDGQPTTANRVRVYAHRLILWQTLGPGQHPCHWCGRPLDWEPGFGGITTDHLNDDPRDNRPENLVVSCHGCNSGRSIHQRAFRPAIGQGEDWLPTHGRRGPGRVRATRLNCQECGAEFLAENARVKRGTVRFCSRHCAGVASAAKRWHPV
jgi:hypothetical protein